MNSPEEDVKKHMLKFQGKLPSYIKTILTKIVTHTDQILLIFLLISLKRYY